MAGYNNYFPQSYANTQYGYGASTAPAQTWTTSTPAQNTLGAINWVQGEAGARSVLVPAGQKVLLMDSETNVFYIKSSDASGMPLPLRAFEYKEVGDNTASAETTAQPQSMYVTHEELERALMELKESSKSKPEPKQKEEKQHEFII